MVMSLTRFIKDLLRKPESIPTPGAIFYNATVAKVLRKPETKIANDVVTKMGKGTILDLGSGTGYLAIEIARKALGLQVCGIDLSRRMVKIARRHAKGVDNAQYWPTWIQSLYAAWFHQGRIPDRGYGYARANGIQRQLPDGVNRYLDEDYA